MNYTFEEIKYHLKGYTIDEFSCMIDHVLQDNRFGDAIKKDAYNLAASFCFYFPSQKFIKKLRKAWRRRLYIRKYKARGKRK